MLPIVAVVAGNKIKFRKPTLQIGCRAVLRVVVNDKHFRINVLNGTPHTVETLLKVVFYVIADYDYA